MYQPEKYPIATVVRTRSQMSYLSILSLPFFLAEHFAQSHEVVILHDAIPGHS